MRVLGLLTLPARSLVVVGALAVMCAGPGCVTTPGGSDGSGDAHYTDVSNREGRAAARTSIDPRTGETVEHVGVCQGGRWHCDARIVTDRAGEIRPFDTPTGFGPPDLQSAYGTDPTLGSGITVAIVDAYGYPTLESDMAMYRTQYGLPACTVANGCLRIVNQDGGSDLPDPPPEGDDWTVETALDVDMISAACPLCNILVVQANQDGDNGLFIANDTAAELGATVISDSWGGVETPEVPATETYFDHPRLAIFVAAGDNGYDDNGLGPDYPGTSAQTISVGATTLTAATGGTRAWSEAAWSQGGSACSTMIAKPSYQPANSTCGFKATADISSVGDPGTGLAIYNTNDQGWTLVGGSSASSPFIAALFGAVGRGNVRGGFLYENADKFNDVTTGQNGDCGTVLCNAGAGWDGPTGVGTPNQALITGGDDLPGASTVPNDLVGGCAAGAGSRAGAAAMLAALAIACRRRRRSSQ